MSYGGTYFGSLVFGAGLVVAALTPVPPAGDSNGYGTSGAGSHVYGAGAVVTSQTPVPPAATGDGNGYGSCVYGGGVFGAGCVVTSQTPVPPTSVDTSGGWYIEQPDRKKTHVASIALVQSAAKLSGAASVLVLNVGASVSAQSPAVIAGRGEVIPRELTEAGEEELLLALLCE